jgi:osmotically-inducible protein OsmY
MRPRLTSKRNRVERLTQGDLAMDRFVGEGNPDLAIDDSRNDQQLMEEVRKAINADDSIDDLLRGIRITVKEGKVRLSGVVFSLREKKAIAEKAKLVVGSDKVEDRLEIIEEMP